MTFGIGTTVEVNKLTQVKLTLACGNPHSLFVEWKALQKNPSLCAAPITDCVSFNCFDRPISVCVASRNWLRETHVIGL